MKKIKTSKQTRIIDTVKVMVAAGQPIEYKIPSTFTGEAFQSWKERNRKEIEMFVSAIDPNLLTVKHTHKPKKGREQQLSDYSNNENRGMSKKVTIEAVIEAEENDTNGGTDEE
jgi:hypothetical protein